MKKQKINVSTPRLAATLIGILILTINFDATAQTTVNTEASVTIPTGKTYLYVTLQGGDGGHGNSSGGQGAWVEGYLEIGTGTNQLNPGGALKIIAGEAGKSNNQGSGGGGGSAVVYKAPGASSWIVLAVAGGGGGAGGSNGGAASVELKNATAGSTNGLSYFGGGSAFNDCNTSNSARGRAGMNNNQPTRAAGGSGGKADGGRGFGSGAAGIMIFGDMKTSYSGGGGGGYYGGDGVDEKGGNGGGSYYNSNYFPKVFAMANGTTNSSKDGYVNYQFLDQVPALGKAIKFAYNTNKCIDDYGSRTANGTNIQTYNCTGNGNQQWYIQPEKRSIRSLVDLNKCLDLDNSNTNNGANIQLYDCNGSSAQKWVYNGLYKTIHSGVNSGKCFDAANGSYYSTSNVNIQLWDCQYTNANQKWVIDGVTTVNNPANVKHIVPVLAPNFAVHSHTGEQYGSNIQLWTKDDTNTAEQWDFAGLIIKMRINHNLCIDLHSSNTDNGNNIQLWGCNGTNAQKWLYDGMTKSIRSVINPDKCMQIEKNTDGVYGKRSNVDIQDCNGSAEQQFLIQE
ncbi:MAG: ricin-type beta-trefoil lectin domain protein [Lewinellaceae bacterium]|nr:ricin-type beta-trefoil lectin domain protein [Lewinellaceae bacterium]